MGLKLKQIFTPGTDEVEQQFIINAWHVSQSVDAFTGAADYDITISGSLTLTGSAYWTGDTDAAGIAVDHIVIDQTTGKLYTTGSVGGANGTSGTSGDSGTSGTSGAGTSGTSGAGTSGTSGNGVPGTSGTSGLQGSPGTSGTSGLQGSPGTSGTSGAGTSGTSGACAMTRPGSASGITIYGTTDLAGVGNYTNFFSVAGGTPSNNGDISVDDTDPTQVANIRIYDTDDSGDNHSNFFDSIIAGSQIQLLTNGVGAFSVTYDVIGVTDNGNYHTFNVSWNTGGSSSTFTTTQTFDDLIFTPETPTYQLSEGYNRIYVTNQSGVTSTLRLAAPNNPSPNECIHVELAKANTGVVNIDYWVRGYSGGTYEKIKPVYSTDSTLERISIGNSNGKVVATFKTWAIGTGADNFGLILEGAEKFNNA